MSIRTSKIIFLLILTLFLCLFLSSCIETIKLDTPTGLKFEGNYLTWDAVPNATSYKVYIQEEVYTANNNSYYILVEDNAEYSVKVMAIGDEKGRYSDSDYSPVIIYVKQAVTPPDNLPRLSIPTGVAVQDGILTWNAVTFAIGYKVRVVYPNANVTYDDVTNRTFTLVGSIDGVYSISISARANSDTHRDSLYSASFSYEVLNSQIIIKELRPPIQITFNNGRLNWSRVAYATGYIININGVDTHTIASGNIISYDLGFTEQGNKVVKIKSVGDSVNYGSSVYSSSINFPLKVSSPPENISIINGKLNWSEDSNATAYRISVNGSEIDDITDNNYELDFSSDGFHSVRLKSVGDNIYYTDSPYSAEIGYRALNGNPVALPLEAPVNMKIDTNSIMTWDSVLLAESYEVYVEGMGGRIVNESMASVLDLTSGVFAISVKARGDNVYTLDSPWSMQLFHIDGDYIGPVILAAPEYVRLVNSQITWAPVSNSMGYEVTINGDVIPVIGADNFLSSDYMPDDGLYYIKVRAIGTMPNYANSPYSEEIVIEKPTRLSTPSNIFITGNTLNWTKVNGAFGYQVEIKGGGGTVILSTSDNYYDIDLDIDGTYTMRVRARGNDEFYISSLYSQEVIYIKQDGSLGGIENPYLIEKIEDLDIIRNNLSSYFRLIADIDLDGIDYEPIGSYNNPFSGYLDGYGYTISNISIDSYISYSGLFGYVNGGTIINLTLDGVTINIDNYVEPPVVDPDSEEQTDYIPGFIYSGGLLAYGRNVVIDNCSLNDININVRSNSVTVGLLGGNVKGDVSNITVNGIVQAESSEGVYAGGMMGSYEGDLDDITVGAADNKVSLVITTEDLVYAGGIAGKLAGNSLTNVNVFVEIAVVSSDIAYVGGGAGTIGMSEIDNINIILTLNINTIVARVGGFSGAGDGIFSNVTTAGNIIVNAENTAYVGGIFGELYGSLTDSISECIIIVNSETAYVGGLIGRGEASVQGAEGDNDLTVNALGDVYIGGMTGYMYGDIEAVDIQSVIVINGEFNILYSGGIVGYYKGNIDNSTASFDIVSIESLSNIFSGGAIGYCVEGDINNLTISRADIELVSANGLLYVGGAVGKHVKGLMGYAVIEDAIIDVAGSDKIYAGGVTGESLVVISNSSSIIDITVSSENNSVYAGGIAGVTSDVIYLCSVNGVIDVSGAGVFAGGISGISGDLAEVSFRGSIKGVTVESNEIIEPEGEEPIAETSARLHVYLGGIVGLISGDIDEATVVINMLTGDSILGKAYVGGIAGKQEIGQNTSLFVNSTVTRLITAIAKDIAYVGGVSGYSTGLYSSVYDGDNIISYAAIIDIDVVAASLGTAYAGSFSGCFSGIVDGVIASGNVTVQSSGIAYAGGFSGLSLASSISDASISSYVTAISSDNVYTGGVIGYMLDSSISQSVFSGVIDGYGKNTFKGGIAGYAKGNIFDSYSKGIYIGGSDNNLYVGGIAGEMNEGLVNRCYSIFNVTYALDYKNAYIGGIAGVNQYANIVNTYSIVNINVTNGSTDDYIGGLSGFNNNGSIISSYVTGSMKGTIDVGSEMPFIGSFIGANNSTVEKCVYDSLMLSEYNGIGNGSRLGLSEEVMGANCSANGYDGWDAENSWVFDEGYYPRIKGLDGQNVLTLATANLTEIILTPNSPTFDLNKLLLYTFNHAAIFKGAYYTVPSNNALTVTPDGIIDLYANTVVGEGMEVTIQFEGGISLVVIIYAQNVTEIYGLGTALNPFIISDATWMRYIAIRPSAFFKLTDNIDLTDIIWEPVGTIASPFTGGLDGDGYTITGLTNPIISQYQGLFGYTDGAIIKDLTIQGININSESPYGNVYAGGVVAYAVNTTIDNVTLRGVIKSKASTGNSFIGSVIGYGIDMTLNSVRSSVSLDVEANASECQAGGLAGYMRGTINNSYYKSSIDIKMQFGSVYAGGLIGSAYGANILNSYAVVNLYFDTNEAYVVAGGLVGQITTYYGNSVISSEIRDCYASSNIDFSSNSVLNGYSGGLIGYNEGTVTRSYSVTDDIEGYYYGLFIGYNLGTINDCYYYKNDTYNSTGVATGSNNGLTGVSGNFLMSGIEIIGWTEWTFDIGFCPRLTGLSGQDHVTSFNIVNSIDLDDTDNLINLLDYLTYTVDINAIFSGIMIDIPDNNVITVIDGSFVLLMGNGTVIVTIYFDGGLSSILTINVTNAPAPLFSAGRGTLADPFLITNAYELDNIRLFRHMNYILGNDINLASIEWVSLGALDNPFTGVFEGNGHSISNLNGESLFGYINGATINGLDIVGADVTLYNREYAGILAEKANNSTIENCSIDNTSSINTNATYYGSFAGMLEYSNLINSFNSMFINAQTNTLSYVGGLVGRAFESTIDNCYVNTAISMDITGDSGYLGGFAGHLHNTEITNSNSDIIITGSVSTGSGYYGGIVGYSINGDINNCVFNVTITIASVESNGTVYTGGLIANATSSTVTSTNLIVNIEVTNSNIVLIGGMIADANGELVIDTIDITASLTSTLSNQVTVGGLAGNSLLSVINYVVSNIAIDVTANETVLIGGLIANFNGIIDDVNMILDINAESVNSSVIIGGIAAISEGEIANITISGTIIVITDQSEIFVGGIAGKDYNTITSIDSNMSISAYNTSSHIYIGGITGKSIDNTISDSTIAGTLEGESINGTLYIGSISGHSYNNTISGIEAYAVINVETSTSNIFAGGISGYNFGNIQDSFYKGSITINTVTGLVYSGGLIGEGYESAITRCYAVADIDITLDDSSVTVGGLAGVLGSLFDSYVNDCYSSVTVIIVANTLEGYTGGLIGYSQAIVTNSYSSSVRLDGAYVGAFMGNNSGSINNCYYYRYDSYNSSGVYEGESAGIEGVSGDFLMSGDVITGWSEWTFDIGKYPRITGLNDQEEVSNLTLPFSLDIDAPTNLINLLDYLIYSVDALASFKGISISIPNEDVFVIINGVFVMVMDNGTVNVSVTVDGGITGVIAITITNAPVPLFESGNGSSLNPFIITTPEQLDNIRDYQSFAYKLNNDIDLNTITWVSFGTEELPFNGTFDGNGFSILNVTGDSIFGYINNAEIINLDIIGANITVTHEEYAGVFAIYAVNSVIENCTIDNTSTLTSDAIMYGGFVGLFEFSELIDCTSDMDIDIAIDVMRAVGGLIGLSFYSTIDNCSSTSEIIADVTDETAYIGGFVGYNQKSSILNSISNITITVTYSSASVYVGGLVGMGDGAIIDNCSITVDITLTGNDVTYAGGLIAITLEGDDPLNGLISDTTITGTITLNTLTASTNVTNAIVAENYMGYDNITDNVIITVNLL